MQSLFSKLTACSLIVGGFAVTGDLGRLAERGTSLLNATSVPQGDETAAGGYPSQPTPAQPVRPVPPPTPAASPAPVLAGQEPRARPSARQRLPVSSPASIDFASLHPGDRLTIWAGSPPAPYAFDVVDPTTGEVLERDSAAGQPAVTPRRLRLAADSGSPARLSLGATLRLVPLGIAHGGAAAAPADMLGPVRAIQLQ